MHRENTSKTGGSQRSTLLSKGSMVCTQCKVLDKLLNEPSQACFITIHEKNWIATKRAENMALAANSK